MQNTGFNPPSIIVTNVRSIRSPEARKKFTDKFKDEDKDKDCYKNADCIAVTETWLKSSDDTTADFPGFLQYRCDRDLEKWKETGAAGVPSGGVMLLVNWCLKENTKCIAEERLYFKHVRPKMLDKTKQPITQPTSSTTLHPSNTTIIESTAERKAMEVVVVKCRPKAPPEGIPAVYVIVVYINQTMNTRERNKCKEKLYNIIATHCTERDCPIVIAGDFNKGNELTVTDDFELAARLNSHIEISTKKDGGKVDKCYSTYDITAYKKPVKLNWEGDHFPIYLEPNNLEPNKLEPNKLEPNKLESSNCFNFPSITVTSVCSISNKGARKRFADKFEDKDKASKFYKNADCIAVTDTWLKSGDKTVDFKQQGFHHYRCDRDLEKWKETHKGEKKKGCGGGVMLLVNEDWCSEENTECIAEERLYFKCVETPDETNKPITWPTSSSITDHPSNTTVIESKTQKRSMEVVVVRCRPENLPERIPAVYVIVVYINQPMNTRERNMCKKKLYEIISKNCTEENCPIVIAGDFNKGNELKDTDGSGLAFPLYSHINVPTHKNGNKLDKCYSNYKTAYKKPVKLDWNHGKEHHTMYLEPNKLALTLSDYQQQLKKTT